MYIHTKYVYTSTQRENFECVCVCVMYTRVHVSTHTKHMTGPNLFIIEPVYKKMMILFINFDFFINKILLDCTGIALAHSYIICVWGRGGAGMHTPYNCRLVSPRIAWAHSSSSVVFVFVCACVCMDGYMNTSHHTQVHTH